MLAPKFAGSLKSSQSLAPGRPMTHKSSIFIAFKMPLLAFVNTGHKGSAFLFPVFQYQKRGRGGWLWPVAKGPPKISKATNEQKLTLGEGGGGAPIAKVPPKKSFGELLERVRNKKLKQTSGVRDVPSQNAQTPELWGAWTMVNGPWFRDHGPWTMVHGPWTMVHGPQTSGV